MVILASEPPRSREVMAAGGLPRDLMAASGTDEPFSAIWTNAIVRTLSDDAHIRKHGHHFFDTGFGRTRTRGNAPSGGEG
jgi:hypothetical protein